MPLPVHAPRQLLPLAAALGLVLSGPALAQPPMGYGGYGGPPGQGYGAPPNQGYGAPPNQGAGGGGQADLARLHAALHITAAQESAWRAFAAASAPDPQQEARERSAEQMLAKLTSPQRVDLSIAAAEADLGTLRQRGQALKAFYATLTPSQQATFDRETLPRAQDEGGDY